MIEIRQSETFRRWRERLSDQRLIAAISLRLARLATGNPGDVKPVGDGISELRFDYGPGYRIYFQQRGTKIILLLCGGDKSTQQADIKRAKRLADEWEEEDA